MTASQSGPHDEKKNDSASNFLAKLGAPARNALLHEQIDTPEKLAAYTEKDILKIHGIGPASLPVMKNALAEQGLEFKKQ